MITKAFQAAHQEALKEFDAVQSTMRDERLQCLRDRRFYSISGAQWEGSLGEHYEDKLKFEVNKIHLAIIRIFNEYRNNRVSVVFSPKDGSKNDKLADVCASLFRADEHDSVAEEAYDNGFEEAVGGGYGAVRLRTVYEDEDEEYEEGEERRQRIIIEPLYDADTTVYFDLGAKRQDKSDAKRCWLLTSYTREAYKEKWGDDPSSWPKEVTQTEFDWATPDTVWVCEEYKVEKRTEEVQYWASIDGDETRYTDIDFKADEELLERLLVTGHRLVRTAKVKRKRVHKYIYSGVPLEDCGIIAGNCIPVAPIYGKRWFVDNRERCMGHGRLATDSQRLKNMQISKLGELAAKSSAEKPIFTPEQMVGHTEMWSNDNIKDYPYLLINPMTDAGGNPIASGPIAYTKPPQIPPALGALLQITEQDIQDLLGNQQAGEEMQSNISGKVVELIQTRLDQQSYIYISNFAKSMRRIGQIWLGMAKEVYVEPQRRMKGLTEQGDAETIELVRPVIKDGETKYENDLSQAKYEVNVEIGPTSVSKRNATVRNLTAMLPVIDDPEAKAVLNAMIMMNMDGEGVGEAREFFRKKLLAMGAVKPTEEEAQELAAAAQNAQPNANDLYLQKAAEAEEAKAAESRATVVDRLASADKKQAETAKIMSEIDDADARLVLEGIDRIQRMAGGNGQ